MTAAAGVSVHTMSFDFMILSSGSFSQGGTALVAPFTGKQWGPRLALRWLTHPAAPARPITCP